MQMPVEVSYRNIPKEEEVDLLIQEKIRKLDEMFPGIVSCRIAIEKPQEHQRSGRAYRVRLEIKAPRNHTIVVTRPSGEGDMHESLDMVIRQAFEAARRRMQAFAERRRRAVKTHFAQLPDGVVVRLFPEEGFGFLKTANGREIYFHRNSVVYGRFEDLSVGAGVRFTEEQGEKGPQAKTVQLVQAAQLNVAATV